jgi:membrane protease YdiL (CAAX protease family)
VIAPFAPPFVAEKVGIGGWYFIAFFGLLLPWKAWQSRAKLAGRPLLPPRARYFTSVIATQVLLYAIGLAIAYICGIHLYPRVIPRPQDLLLGVLILGTLLAFMVPRWRGAVKKGDRRLYFFMPAGAKEKALWAGVSVAAGFGEESIYRGVLFALLFTLTGSLWVAALLGALVFAAGHAFQSLRSMAIIFAFSLIFQAIVIVTGALYVSMAVHFLYDLAAGFTYSRLGTELGYRAEGEPGVPAPQPLG